MNATTLLVFSAVVAINIVLAEVISEEREEDELERIIGGQNATEGQFPWAAALFFNGRFICTSSIISNWTVMTAAHCVTDRNGNRQTPGSFYAIANYKKSSPSVRIDFAKLVVHPKYNPRSVDNDIAIFKTSVVIPTQPDVQRICIAGPDTRPMQYFNGTAMGWGNMSPVRLVVVIPDVLQHVEQTIIPNLGCTALGAPSMTPDKICATGPFNGVCNGDSGGPLVHISADKEPVQLGVASYLNAIFGCGKISPAVWARVSRYHKFISEHVFDRENLCVI